MELPIGYYLGQKVPVIIEDDNRAYCDVANREIHIGMGLLQKAADNIPPEAEVTWSRQKLLRCLLYHEVAHLILTPKELFSTLSRSFRKRGMPVSEEEARAFINIFEDERIETLLKNFFMDTDFKSFVKLVSADAPESHTDFQKFFDVVRLRKTDESTNDAINGAISATSGFSAVTDGGFYTYVRNLQDLIDKVFGDEDDRPLTDRMMDKLDKMKEDSLSYKEDLSAGEACYKKYSMYKAQRSRSLDKGEIDEMLKELEKFKSDKSVKELKKSLEEIKATAEEKKLSRMLPDSKAFAGHVAREAERHSKIAEAAERAVALLEGIKEKEEKEKDGESGSGDGSAAAVDVAEKESESPIDIDGIRAMMKSRTAAIFGKPSNAMKNTINRLVKRLAKKRGRLAGGVWSALSGRIETRRDAQDKDRIFRKHGDGEKIMSATALTIWIDKSGSFHRSESKINEICQSAITASKISKGLMTVNICTVGDVAEKMDLKDLHITCNGGNAINSTLVETAKKVYDPVRRNINIVVFDGPMMSNDVAENLRTTKKVGEGFMSKVWNTRDTFVVSDDSNREHFDAACPLAKKTYVDGSYAENLEAELIKVLERIM